MLLLLKISESLALCREYTSGAAVGEGDLVPLSSNGLRGRVLGVDIDLIHVFISEADRWVKVLRASGWRHYEPEPPLQMRIPCTRGDEKGVITWAMSISTFELSDGTIPNVKFLRAWTHDRYPGMVMCEFRRVRHRV